MWDLQSWQEKMPVISTSIPSLGLTQIEPDCWQFLDLSDAPERVAQVGQHYKTKEEAMGDLERYARETWGY